MYESIACSSQRSHGVQAVREGVALTSQRMFSRNNRRPCRRVPMTVYISDIALEFSLGTHLGVVSMVSSL